MVLVGGRAWGTSESQVAGYHECPHCLIPGLCTVVLALLRCKCLAGVLDPVVGSWGNLEQRPGLAGLHWGRSSPPVTREGAVVHPLDDPAGRDRLALGAARW